MRRGEFIIQKTRLVRLFTVMMMVMLTASHGEGEVYLTRDAVVRICDDTPVYFPKTGSEDGCRFILKASPLFDATIIRKLGAAGSNWAIMADDPLFLKNDTDNTCTFLYPVPPPQLPEQDFVDFVAGEVDRVAISGLKVPGGSGSPPDDRFRYTMTTDGAYWIIPGHSTVDIHEGVTLTAWITDEYGADVSVISNWECDLTNGGSFTTQTGDTTEFTATSPGTYTITATTTNPSRSATATVDAARVDLDIDSDNNNGLEASFPRTAFEDEIEDHENRPGKFVCVNRGDVDDDGVPNFADGFDMHGNSGSNAGGSFTPLILEIDEPLDLSLVKVRFTYSASDPSGVTRTGTEPYVYGPATGDAAGNLRIWTVDGSADRSKAEVSTTGGHYVKPGSEYTAADLGLDTVREIPLYVEGINNSTEMGSDQIKVEVDPDGSGPAGFQCTDAVRVTIFNVEFDNVWDRNLDPLDDDADLASYDKCVAIEHDVSGELDLDGEEPANYLRIEPEDLTWDDLNDVVALEIAHTFFDTANIDGAVLKYDITDPGDHDIYSFGLQLKCEANGDILDRLVLVIYDEQTEESYKGVDGWVSDDANPIITSASPGWTEDLPPPYDGLAGPGNDENPEPPGCDPQRWKDDVSDDPQTNNYHYDAEWDMRSVKIANGAGHQACYNAAGDLNEATPDSPPMVVARAGTADRHVPISDAHSEHDVWPFVRAAQLDGNPVEASWGMLELPVNLSDPLIRVGDNLRAYYERRPPLTTPNQAKRTCIP